MYFAIGSVRQRAYCISSTATLHVAQSYLPSGVASIAYELGFQDPACFSRAFKRHAGMTLSNSGSRPRPKQRMPARVAL